MIIGAHSIIYSTQPEADRAFLRDVLGLNHVDVGDGWLIFGLPPAEVAVHPSQENDVHEFYLMCDDVERLIAELSRQNVVCSPPQSLGWGVRTEITLPGGGKLGVYQPRHARPKPMSVRKPKVRAGRPATRTPRRARQASANRARRRH
jgi:hypothetical protein